MNKCKSGVACLAMTGLVLSLSSTTTSAANQNESDAYQTCINNASKQVGVKRYSIFERKYAKAKNSKGVYRFYLNSTYKHPDLEAVREYRTICESGGFAKLKSIEVQAGQWRYPEGRSGMLTVDDEKWLAQQ